ncbi:hypothetical protein BZZ01_08810 [Nostocales cyanobacterium HT-58-2]|nr:hypothetical protein BZZ01_08810 [Nostocales cyanobacterium HT-58-2]
MEPATLTAAAIATLIFSEAVKEGGKTLGKGVSEQIAKLLNLIRDKFQSAGTEGLLTRAQENPVEKNTSKFQDELETQMEEDETFANQLRELMKELESTGVVRQVMASGIEVSGALEAADMQQKTTRGGTVEQEMLKDIKAGDVKLGNLTQES